MAKHADGAGQLTAPSPVQERGPTDECVPDGSAFDEYDMDADETDKQLPHNTETDVQKRFSKSAAAISVGLVAVVVLGALAGWFGYDVYENRQAEAQRNQFVEAARQGVVNLTTIDHTTAEADIERILDSSTGAFREGFEQRSQPFIDVVKRVQSKSTGTVTAAGIESREGDQAQVLVTVSVDMSNTSAPEQQPRAWRMRINVEKTGEAVKVSDVQFVP